jgi:hypothetical protein
MNFNESIHWLAKVHSTKCYPKVCEDDIDKSLPYFQLIKERIDKYTFKAFNYETHDNAPRMTYVADYLLKHVLPNVEGDLSGYYNIQLHDNYSYLHDSKCYNGVLCFGGMKQDCKNRWVVQLPDCYFMGNWGGKYDIMIDCIEWKNKKSKIIFAGTTTGSRDPLKNERINTCLWSLKDERRNICDFHITNIAQINPREILTKVPDFKYIYTPPISLKEQMQYKYHLSIDGNTCRWNPDVYFMNSLNFQLTSKDMLWYYPLLRNNEHYIEVSTTENSDIELIKKYKYYENNPQDAQRIIRNANELAKKLFNSNVCQQYTIALFENIADNK